MAGTSTKTTQKAIRFPNELIAEVDQSIDLAGVKSRNDLVIKAVREYLERLAKV
jgi:metal-responsive CopG/Arc/MetJ family transcriptional regulator